jgi:hypothetical protein
MRKRMMLGKGRGYKNVIPHDRPVHQQSAKGIKQPQKITILRSPKKLFLFLGGEKKLIAKGKACRVVFLKNRWHPKGIYKLEIVVGKSDDSLNYLKEGADISTHPTLERALKAAKKYELREAQKKIKEKLESKEQNNRETSSDPYHHPYGINYTGTLNKDGLPWTPK